MFLGLAMKTRYSCHSHSSSSLTSTFLSIQQMFLGLAMKTRYSCHSHSSSSLTSTFLTRHFSQRVREIAPTAIVETGANVAHKVHVGHYSIIGSATTLKSGVEIGSHVVVTGQTQIDEDTQVHSFATIGGPPQNKKNALNSKLFIGKRCVIRENVTINTGTVEETIINDDVWLLAGAHVGHDAHIQEQVVVSNAVQIAGHVRIGRWTVIGGMAAIQQFCSIGTGSMIGGATIVDHHVPPYSLVVGNRARFRGINVRGLRRRGIPNSYIFPLLTVSKQIYASSHVLENAREKLLTLRQVEKQEDALATEFLEFVVGVSQIRAGWCARRASIGIVKSL